MIEYKMYLVNKILHDLYGNIIEIVRNDDKIGYMNPFQAIQMAKKERRLWHESGIKKIRYLIDDQIMNVNQIDHWANEEYKSLPKCETCGAILGEQVYTHQFCGNNLFCSQSCTDKNYLEQTEKIKDEEEIEYL
jgi:hypothetical protein